MITISLCTSCNLLLSISYQPRSEVNTNQSVNHLSMFSFFIYYGIWYYLYNMIK